MGKLARLREMTDLALRYASGLGSKMTILDCYRTILRTTTDKTPVSLTLRIGGRKLPFSMRKGDIFTLAEILHERQYELSKPLPNSPVIIDAGANVGVSAVWFHARFPGATVHAFEPEPQNFSFLASNVEGLEGVTANQLALGGAEGTIALHLADHGAVHSMVDTSVGTETVDVAMAPLADYLDDHGIERIDLLKLDVEGAEDAVLDGLGDRLADVSVVVGELHEQFVHEGDFYRRLEDHGIEPVRKTYYGDGEAEGVHAFEARRSR